MRLDYQTWAKFSEEHGGRVPLTFFSLVLHLERFQNWMWSLSRFVWRVFHFRCYT